MTRSASKRPTRAPDAIDPAISRDYFRLRDFEYVQPLYDLAFLLEVGALADGGDIPKYRTFSLWRAGYSLDGYSTTIDRLLDGAASVEDLDYVPSSRILQYLNAIRRTGTIPELRSYRNERFSRCLRLRSVRGLGVNKIAMAVGHSSVEGWFDQTRLDTSFDRDRIAVLFRASNPGPWQTAHIVPPLLRFLNAVQKSCSGVLRWEISGITDPFEPVIDRITVAVNGSEDDFIAEAIEKALKREKQFRCDRDAVVITHRMGWNFTVNSGGRAGKTIPELVHALDPLASSSLSNLLSDLHLHTAWSDGSATVNTMATAVVASGLRYFAVTDHSRSCKLQGGLTPPLWLRQANALTLAAPLCPVLHSIEVDILKDGSLDLPKSLLEAADFVVASVHSNWTDDARVNTDRLLKAIESGCIDVIGHPTSAVIGKPGVPDYVRSQATVYWNEVFEKCSLWRVALEMNCFPSRLDLPLTLAKKAIEAGCPISIGSDSHARSHLINLRFGDAALGRLGSGLVLNRFSYEELKRWLYESRAIRKKLTKRVGPRTQAEFQFEPVTDSVPALLRARIQLPQQIPAGSRVVGVDLTAGDKATGIALLDGSVVETCSLFTDDEILAYIEKHKPGIVSIDSPLGLPGGGNSIDPDAGIVRVAEADLASIGIPAYPALIDSMQNLTLRGIRLRRAIEHFPQAPRVIESYPGAAQDILCIPRKQKGLDLLREGLRRLGLTGQGLETRSHDEMDAVTSAIVGRYFESGRFEAMGIPSEAQLIVPKLQPLVFQEDPIICLSGRTGVGKSVVARYLSVFYGFEWIKTRDIISSLLREDLVAPTGKRLSTKPLNPDHLSEEDLREFGALILDVYKQKPLRAELTKLIRNSPNPIVVDAVRDLVDVEDCIRRERHVITWFIDCSDSVIRTRTITKTKLGERRPTTTSLVDHTAASLRLHADYVLPNNGSLEELRWRIDDSLFGSTELSAD